MGMPDPVRSVDSGHSFFPPHLLKS
jgi:hypothetical protein